jgi:hypothetical protein
LHGNYNANKCMSQAKAKIIVIHLYILFTTLNWRRGGDIDLVYSAYNIKYNAKLL